MPTNKVTLAGSERQPIGTRVGDQPNDELIEVSVILKPKVHSIVPLAPGPGVSREEFAAKHGADPSAIEKVKQYAKENNLTVEEVSPERRTVKLQGTAVDMTRAFETKLDRYEHEGHQYRARTGGIKLPPELAPSVEAVLGLDNRLQAKPHFRGRAAQPDDASKSANISYTPRQVAQLYQFPLTAAGTGETIGILELGGGYKL